MEMRKIFNRKVRKGNRKVRKVGIHLDSLQKLSFSLFAHDMNEF
jgi:hypothetical protein